MQEKKHSGRARATEGRRQGRVVEAVLPFFADEREAERMVALVEEDKANDPYWREAAAMEGPAGKLERMRGSASGRRWLAEHPDATWADIAEAPL